MLVRFPSSLTLNLSPSLLLWCNTNLWSKRERERERGSIFVQVLLSSCHWLSEREPASHHHQQQPEQFMFYQLSLSLPLLLIPCLILLSFSQSVSFSRSLSQSLFSFFTSLPLDATWILKRELKTARNGKLVTQCCLSLPAWLFLHLLPSFLPPQQVFAKYEDSSLLDTSGSPSVSFLHPILSSLCIKLSFVSFLCDYPLFSSSRNIPDGKCEGCDHHSLGWFVYWILMMECLAVAGTWFNCNLSGGGNERSE